VPASAAGALPALQPPVAALSATGAPSTGAHALGFQQNPQAEHLTTATLSRLAQAVPASVDLSQYNPPVGNQGQVGSCTAWATGYYLRGWYARRGGYYPSGPDANGGFAPMYTYAQIVHGQNIGTTFPANLTIQQQQGIDSRADYTQGDYDYTDQPTAAEQAYAGQYTIPGWHDVAGPAEGGPALQSWIEATIAGGNPVVISIPVYDNFFSLSPSNFFYASPSGPYEGGHALFASKYDANGLWVENQWGTGWGLNGWAELSWSFLNQYQWEAATIQTPAPPTLAPFRRYYNPSTATHWVTTGLVGAGYTYEEKIADLLRAPQPNTRALYDCLHGANDHFVSMDAGCEGYVRLSIDGYLYTTPITGTTTIQIYRCYRQTGLGSDHFISADPRCEGQMTEGSLGYALP
jgi:hypothetical protein